MYFTDEKQKLIASNLNYLMRKKNLTNAGLQEACYGETDRNGKIIARLRGGLRRFTMDDVLTLSKVLDVTLETFTEINLEELEEAKIEVAEGLLMRPHENPKHITYRYLEIRGYRLVPAFIFLALLTNLLIGCCLTFAIPDISKYIFISIGTLLSVFLIIYLAYGAVNVRCHIHEFTLPDTVAYSFINKKSRRRPKYLVMGIFECIILCLLAATMIVKDLYDGKIVSALLLDCLFLTIIPILLYYQKEPKFLAQIPYYLYISEMIRRFFMILLSISMAFYFYFTAISPELLVIMSIYLSGICILSEFMNSHITHYYMGYTGREEA